MFIWSQWCAWSSGFRRKVATAPNFLVAKPQFPVAKCDYAPGFFEPCQSQEWRLNNTISLGTVCKFPHLPKYGHARLGEGVLTLHVSKKCKNEKKKKKKEIHLFAGRAVKRERRKGSSRRQQPTYGAAVNEVARELLRSARSPKRENGGRRYIKHDGMIASPVGSCLCC